MDIELSSWIMSRILVLMALYSTLTQSILCSCNDVFCQGTILSLSFDMLHLAGSSFGVLFKSTVPLHNRELISVSLTPRTMSLHSNDCDDNKECLVKWHENVVVHMRSSRFWRSAYLLPELQWRWPCHTSQPRNSIFPQSLFLFKYQIGWLRQHSSLGRCHSQKEMRGLLRGI